MYLLRILTLISLVINAIYCVTPDDGLGYTQNNYPEIKYQYYGPNDLEDKIINVVHGRDIRIIWTENPLDKYVDTHGNEFPNYIDITDIEPNGPNGTPDVIDEIVETINQCIVSAGQYLNLSQYYLLPDNINKNGYVHFYVANFNGNNLMGLAHPTETQYGQKPISTSKGGFAIINQAMLNTVLREAVAHEFCHLVQFSYGIADYSREASIMEQYSQWFIHKVAPGTEWLCGNYIIPSIYYHVIWPHLSILSGGKDAYRTFSIIFFLEEYLNNLYIHQEILGHLAGLIEIDQTYPYGDPNSQKNHPWNAINDYLSDPANNYNTSVENIYPVFSEWMLFFDSYNDNNHFSLGNHIEEFNCAPYQDYPGSREFYFSNASGTRSGGFKVKSMAHEYAILKFSQFLTKPIQIKLSDNTSGIMEWDARIVAFNERINDENKYLFTNPIYINASGNGTLNIYHTSSINQDEIDLCISAKKMLGTGTEHLCNYQINVDPQDNIFNDITDFAGFNESKFQSVYAIEADFRKPHSSSLHLKRPDILLCNVGPLEPMKAYCRLYRNNGNSTFTSVGLDFQPAPYLHYVSRAACAVSFDADNDGYDDLYVGNWRSTTGTEGAENHFYYNQNGNNLLRKTNQYIGLVCTNSRTRGVAYGKLAGTTNDDFVDLIVCNPHDDFYTPDPPNPPIHSSYGYLRVYDNISTPGNPLFNDITETIFGGNKYKAIGAKVIDVDDEEEQGNGEKYNELLFNNLSGEVYMLTWDASNLKYTLKYNIEGKDIFTVGGKLISYCFDVVDLDGDGDNDLFANGEIYRNNGLHTTSGAWLGFTKITDQTGIRPIIPEGTKIWGVASIPSTNNKHDLYLSSVDGTRNFYLKNISILPDDIKFKCEHIFINNVDQGELASGVAILDIDALDTKKKDDIFQCYYNPDVSNVLYENLTSGSYFFHVKLFGMYHKYGSGYSSRKGIGGKVILYENGHMNEENYIVASRVIDGSSAGNVSYSKTIAKFIFENNNTYDIKAVFPSGRIAYVYNASPGDYLIEEPFSANIVSRSIGTQTTPLFNTGTASTNPTKDQVTFSSNLPDNIGEGDKLSIGGETVYILQKVADNRVVLQEPTSSSHSGSSFYIERTYNTLQAWENDRDGDLITRGTIEKGVCYNDGEFTGNLYIKDSETDSAHYLWLTVAEGDRHDGTAGSGVVWKPASGSTPFNVRDKYTIVEWLEIDGSDGGGSDRLLYDYGGYSEGSIFRNLIIHDSPGKGLYLASKSTFYNSIVYNNADEGVFTSQSEMRIRNVTSYNNNYGFRATSNYKLNCINCIGVGNTTWDFNYPGGYAWNSECEYNMSSDTTAPGPDSLINKSASDQFVSIAAGSEDLHLKAGSDAISAGENLSDVFTLDINCVTRPATGPWSMGADEYGVAAKRYKGKIVEEIDLPKVFALHQNMPNPFNPVTTIKYDVPYKKGRDNRYQTLLQIYDIRGKLVTTLVDGIRRPGYYSIVWDGRNKQGKTLASGMYIYKFQSGNFIKKKKMILIK